MHRVLVITWPAGLLDERQCFLHWCISVDLDHANGTESESQSRCRGTARCGSRSVLNLRSPPPGSPQKPSTTNALGLGTSSRILATVAKLQQYATFAPRLRHKTLTHRPRRRRIGQKSFPWLNLGDEPGESGGRAIGERWQTPHIPLAPHPGVSRWTRRRSINHACRVGM